MLDAHTDTAGSNPNKKKKWTIEIRGKHKSIKDLDWQEVPRFAVLTGENGSGKTHLLEAIEKGVKSRKRTEIRDNRRALDIFDWAQTKQQLESLEERIQSGKQRRQNAQHEIDRLNKMEKSARPDFLLNIDGLLTRIGSDGTVGPSVDGELQTSEVIAVYDAYQSLSAKAVKLAEITKGYRDLIPLRDNRRTAIDDSTPLPDSVRSSALVQMGIENPTYGDVSMLAGAQPGSFINVASPLDGVALAFQGYQDACHRFANRRLLVEEKDVEREQMIESVGVPPWDLLNHAFEVAGFSYRVTSPAGSSYGDSFSPAFEKKGVRTDPKMLSSGEKTMVGVICSLYTGQTGGKLPKLLLLDEPDAHLHPSLTHQLIEVLQGVLVERYGIRVIKTTHSPSTVALAPDASLFLMEREPLRVEPIEKWEAASILTAGLTAVGPATKSVFVEDQADEDFYRVVAEIARRGGEPDKRRIPPGRLNFIPASRGQGGNPEGQGGGGWSAVKRFIEDIEGTHIRGMIDRDAGTNDLGSSGRIHTLGRYSIENYLLDPLVLAVFNSRCIRREKRKFDIEGFSLEEGLEAEISKKSEDELQLVVDHVCNALLAEAQSKGDLTEASTNAQKVEWTSGQTLSYPEWFIENRGKTIQGHVQEVFGSPFRFKTLLEALRIVNALPVELAATLRKIAAA